MTYPALTCFTIHCPPLLDHIRPYLMPCLALPYTCKTSLALPYPTLPCLTLPYPTWSSLFMDFLSRMCTLSTASNPLSFLLLCFLFFLSLFFTSLHLTSLLFSSLLLTSPLLSCPILVLYASKSLLRPSKLLILYYLSKKIKFV